MPSSKRASFFQRKQSEKKKPYPKRRCNSGRTMEGQSENRAVTRARGRIEKKKPHPNRPYLGREKKLEIQPIAPSKNGELTIGDITRSRGREVVPIHFLVECATGYALFLAHGINDIDMHKYQPAEEYINRPDNPFELKDYLPFSSLGEALIQMNAISNSSVTEMLIKFIQKNFERPFGHVLTTADPILGEKIVNNVRLSDHTSMLTSSVMRGLREKIDTLIGLQPGELDKAQRQLAHLYKDQKRTILDTESPFPVSSSSFLQEQFMVVPHRFEGFFNAKGKKNILCTRNLVPGEALYGEKLIHVQNEDGTEVEYRVCDPRRSKLGAAILGGVTNIWIKPGSRVMYVGKVCGLTVSDLSDLVGLDGLVYVVGNSDDVTHMEGKRPNVVTIIENDYHHCHYRMVLGMVDAVFGEIDHPLGENDYRLPKKVYMDGRFIVNNVHFYLKTGGHYMICTKADNMNSKGHLIFSFVDQNKEFKLLQTVPLDLVEGTYFIDIGGYRMLSFMTQKSEQIQFTIQPSTFELYSFIPFTNLGGSIKFAPIWLTNMFSRGGTILDLEYVESGAKIKVKGGGNFLAYSSESPKKFQLNGSDVDCEWLSDGKLSLNVPWIEPACGMWIKEETNELFDLCERFDLHFVVIADRFSSSRTVEELNDRYYSVLRAILLARAASSGDVATHPLIKEQYNVSQEMERKRALSMVLSQTRQQEKRDEEVLIEAKRIAELRMASKVTEQSQLVVATNADAEVTERAVPGESLSPSNVQHPPMAAPSPFTDNASTLASLRMLRVYLRTYALEQMVQSSNSSAGVRTIKRVEQTSQDFGVNLKPRVPTKAVCAEHLELRREILTWLNLQKQDRTFIPDSLNFGVSGEWVGKKDQKRKGHGAQPTAAHKRPRKQKASDL